MGIHVVCVYVLFNVCVSLRVALCCAFALLFVFTVYFTRCSTCCLGVVVFLFGVVARVLRCVRLRCFVFVCASVWCLRLVTPFKRGLWSNRVVFLSRSNVVLRVFYHLLRMRLRVVLCRVFDVCCFVVLLGVVNVWFVLCCVFSVRLMCVFIVLPVVVCCGFRCLCFDVWFDVFFMRC